MSPFYEENEVYILENPKKKFEDNSREYNIYQFLLKSVDYTDELFNILTQIKNTFLEREKMIFELNKKIDQEKKELEANISKKIDSLRGNAQSKKKQKTEIEEKIEEVDQLKNIDDIMTIYNK
jgi:hypothetical protein